MGSRLNGFAPIAFAAPIPGGTLDPLGVPKYRTPLLVPPVMPRAGTVKLKGGKNADYYEISMRQFAQQILPAGLPPTTVWGYGAIDAGAKRGLLLHNAPSLTIEADHDRPVRVKWINELVDASGNFLPHLLPVDPTLHWANPPGGAAERDTRPTFASTPGPYTGPVPIVTHVHGAVGVGDESDGYTEAWYLPTANNIPAGYATEGTWYDFFAGKAAAQFGDDLGPGLRDVPVPEPRPRVDRLVPRPRARHDPAQRLRRPGRFLHHPGRPRRRRRRTSTPAPVGRPCCPGPAPRENDKFPPNKNYQEIPIAIQDRSFNADGSLFYPDTPRVLRRDHATTYIPGGDFSPIWNPEFFGNMLIVNGNTWPFLTVERRRYRFRFLNGCQSRFLILDFAGSRGSRCGRSATRAGSWPGR